MNNELLTVTLLLVCVCNLGVLYLYFRIHRWMQTPNDIYGLLVDLNRMVSKTDLNLILALNRLSDAAIRQRGMKQALLDDGRKTRKDIQEVKTALRDEEKADQRTKANARRKGMQS